MNATQTFQSSTFQPTSFWPALPGDRAAFRKDSERLVKRAQQGDLAAFNQLVLAYQDAAYSQACWLLHDDTLAEDATQEAFILAFRHLDTYKGGSFRAWLLKIVTNYCFDQLRVQKARPARSLDLYNEFDEEIENPTWLVDQAASPEAQAETADQMQRLSSCISALAPEYRAALLLVDVQEMDYKQASTVLGVPIGTIKSRVARARMHLNRMWKEAF